ncbi:hypothetical protein Ae201684P_014991 [Aphanomyces euteiches]|nr:hypothetical protein Ae201684P_014991 [Aphanomyces euteiches]
MPMNRLIKNGFVGAIGSTPLIRLATLSAATGCNILAKAEFMNPGGSVKDRAALYVVQESEKTGLLKPGGTIVEGTAGNTGIGLAHVCAAKGYKCVIYMPNTQSQEKIQALQFLGADVRPVPAVPFTDPLNYNHQARDYAAQIPNGVWTNQNMGSNSRQCGCFHMRHWDRWHLGVGLYLKQKNENVKIVLADPPGSVLFNYIKKGVLEREGNGSVTEGIGQGRITENLKNAPIDDAVHIEDHRSIDMVFRLLKDEGIFVGASSGLNVVAACDVAKTLSPGSTIVTILCDSAARYQTRLFSRSWLESKGLYEAVPKDCRHLVSLP